MFKDYTQLAEKQASNLHETVAHQAYQHTLLVERLNRISPLVGIHNINSAYQDMTNQVAIVFDRNIRGTPVSEELVSLTGKNKSYNYQGYNHLNTELSMEDIFGGSPRIETAGKTFINSLFLEIVRKELYIEYVLADTPERQAKNNLQDTVIMMNRTLRTDLCDASLYHLTYMSSADRGGSTGFVHQLKDNLGGRTTPEIMVGVDWVETVFDKGLTLLEYQGARAFTVFNCEFEKDDIRTLYRTTVLQITGTREEVSRAGWSYSSNNEATRTLFKVRELVLSQSADKQHWALGSDAVKAERTMRRRQKGAMMKQLNL